MLLTIISCATPNYYIIVTWCDEKEIIGINQIGKEVIIKNSNKDLIFAGDSLELIKYYNTY